MRCRVRPACRDDLPALCDLLADLFAIERDFTPDQARQRAGLELLLGRPQQARVLVAEVAGEVIGMCTAQLLVSTAEGGEVALVEDVVVRADWRGKGIGTALLAALEAWCRQRGLRRLQLLADEGNATALEFYRALGWTATRLTAWRKYASDS